MMKEVFAFGFFMTICLSEELYKKITPGNPQALCLDGSPSVLYLSEGAEKNKFILYFFGGGACSQKTLPDMLESCYQRSFTLFGTSTLWPNSYRGQGFLSTDPSKNAYYHNWTKILFAYCDGTFHQGYRQAPVNYKGKDLYFRGSKIVEQHLKWINQKYNMYNQAEQVIVAGGSAGAMATYLWGNQIASLVKSTEVRLIIDSGIFLVPSWSKDTFQQSFQVLTGLVNSQIAIPNKECLQRYASQPSYCFEFIYSFDTLLPRTLVVESEYDSYVIQYILRLSCINGTDISKCNSADLDVIESYRSQILPVLYQAAQKQKDSVWAISCANHVYMNYDAYYNNPNQAVPEGSEQTLQQITNRWFNGEKIDIIDVNFWPHNSACAMHP